LFNRANGKPRTLRKKAIYLKSCREERPNCGESADGWWLGKPEPLTDSRQTTAASRAPSASRHLLKQVKNRQTGQICLKLRLPPLIPL
jgi:hypothetical protein